MFEHGKGVVQNIEIAALLYGQAAEKKNTNALYNLARMHTRGLGVIQSHSDAFKYCRMAAFKDLHKRSSTLHTCTNMASALLSFALKPCAGSMKLQRRAIRKQWPL